MLRNCWITPKGEMHPCPNWGDHVHIAHEHFPDADEEIETYACRNGWLKVFLVGEALLFCGRELTHAQRRVVEDFGHIADEVNEEAVSGWRYLESANRTRLGYASHIKKQVADVSSARGGDSA